MTKAWDRTVLMPEPSASAEPGVASGAAPVRVDADEATTVALPARPAARAEPAVTATPVAVDSEAA
ncbi:MAG: hypothetical protein JRI23_33420, partial [Deltaproteobacteria bacterium]|nr:hypothetical protein [Deltaproteobacteria bacterium]MBW2537180.1 hypothetical protein [Deltaproteobacteria bacterium]